MHLTCGGTVSWSNRGLHKAAHELRIALEAVEGSRTIGRLYSSVTGVPVTAIPMEALIEEVVLDCVPERRVVGYSLVEFEVLVN